MPVIFIHGVNTRDGVNYRKNVAARDELIKRLILDPLQVKGDRFKHIEIVNPYWGDLGVKFGWHQATLPEIGEQAGALELFSQPSSATPNADIAFAEMIDDLGATSPALESTVEESSQFKRAAEKDLPAFVEALLLPLIFSEAPLIHPTQSNAEQVGISEALLIVAAQEVGEDDEIKAKVRAATSDDEVIDLLKTAILARFDELAGESETLLPSGPFELDFDWLSGFKDKAGELFDRTKEAPTRAASIPLLKTLREKLHQNITRFVGDVFIYLNERGDKNNPGPIVQTVLQAITTAPKHHAQEPTIIITHSMGGNILYDILTYYAPDLTIDMWISVGGQVGLFEEMKIFKMSDKTLITPQKVMGLAARVPYWLNVYDITDIFSFKVAPVFQDVDEDLVFNTGALPGKSHSDYFKRPSFYRAIRKRIEKALLES